MRILMSPKVARNVTLTMLLTALVLCILSITALLSFERLSQLISARSYLNMSDSRVLARGVIGIVNVDYENNIPTWFSGSVLLLNSVLLAAISSTKKAVGEKYVAHWWGLSVIFLTLSMDEIAGIHDRVNFVNFLLPPGQRTGGIFSAFWVIPWSVFLLLVLLTYLKFFFALPTRIKWLFLGAGGLYIAGALGGEMLLGYMMNEGGGMTLPWFRRLEATTEEFFEMTGAIVFFYALTDILRSLARRGHDNAESA